MECSKLLKEALDDPRFKYITQNDTVSVGSFNGKQVLVEDVGDNKFRVDTSDFMSGSGDGKQFYNMIWDWADKNGKQYDVIPDGLTFVNRYRLAANILDRLKTKPETKAIDKLDARKLVDSAINELNLDLRFDGLNKEIQDLTDFELKDYGEVFGSDSNKRVGYNSLKAFQDYIKGGLTLSALLIILNEGENNAEQ